MKALMIAAIAAAALTSSAGVASAQYGDAVPISRNWRGEPACPSNYVIRGNACVSIYAGGGRRDFYGSYNAPRGRLAQPWINRRGETQCPSNFVLRGGACVNLY